MTPITVWVNDVPMGFMTGAEAWMVLERLPLETRFAVETGQAFLADSLGNEIGTGGALVDGRRLYVTWKA